MPLAVSAQHSALKPRLLSLKLGCFSVDWSLGGVNPVGIGVYCFSWGACIFSLNGIAEYFGDVFLY